MNAILYNGRVYPQLPIRKRPTLVVISGNRIVETGTDLSSARQRYRSYRLIDLGGRTVIPGLVDSHTHMYFWASTLDTVHLEGTATFNEALDAIRTFARGRGGDEWIIGDGWSANRWSEYHLPTARELDSVTDGRPAALFSKDQHILWVNSRALKMAGIDKNYRDPEGGRVDRDPESGEPTGLLRELPGYFPIVKLMSRRDPGNLRALWNRALKMVRSRGITGVHSMDGPEAWAFFEAIHAEKKLGVRVHHYVPVAKLDRLIKDKVVSGMGDETFRIGGVKIFSDGSLGAQTALMKKPYRGSQGGYGVETNSVKELTRMVSAANWHGLACAIHAIGDRGVANVISAYEKAGRSDRLRNRIEHVQIIDRADIGRMKRAGLIASMQPSHCPSDRQLIADYWGRRGRNAYIFKTMLKRGIPLAFGSDCPIEPLDPMAGIHAAVNRNGYGERGGRFYPEESLTVAQAVYGFTAGAAFAAGREAFSGRIAPGFQADLTILEDDIYSMPLSRLYKAQVAATIFDGKSVFKVSSFDI